MLQNINKIIYYVCLEMSPSIFPQMKTLNFRTRIDIKYVKEQKDSDLFLVLKHDIQYLTIFVCIILVSVCG